MSATTPEQELLAVVKALVQWRYYLEEAAKMTVITDHNLTPSWAANPPSNWLDARYVGRKFSPDVILLGNIVVVDGEAWYIIEKVIDHRDLENKKREFLVQWEGYGPEEICLGTWLWAEALWCTSWIPW
jgi:hypothetical protein